MARTGKSADGYSAAPYAPKPSVKEANTDHQSEVGALSALAIADIAAGPDSGKSGLAAGV
jgi:hypothetical protein